MLISRYLNRLKNKPINILTGPTHEAYETTLSKTGFNFYALQAGNFKHWNEKFRPCPDNYILLKSSSIPRWLDIDVVLSQNKFGQYQVLAPIAQKLGVPLISLEHTLPVPAWDYQTRQAVKNMRGHLNVFISDYSINEWGFDKNDESVRVIEHGIDVDKFTPGDKTRKNIVTSVVNDWKNRDWCCGYNLWESTIQGLPFKVLGDNPGLSQPAKSVNDLVDTYQTSRIFYNTSLISPVPSVLLESMACGCAVVSTPTCMIPSIIEHGYNGLLGNTPQELRQHLETLLNNEELANELGRNARKTIEERFNSNRFIQDWKNLILEAAKL